MPRFARLLRLPTRPGMGADDDIDVEIRSDPSRSARATSWRRGWRRGTTIPREPERPPLRGSRYHAASNARQRPPSREAAALA